MTMTTNKMKAEQKKILKQKSGDNLNRTKTTTQQEQQKPLKNFCRNNDSTMNL